MKAPTIKPLRVLLVEDEALIALDVEGRILEQRHEVVGIAADAAEALALAQSQEIDLAFVDLNLRDGLTGPEIAKVLANVYQIPVIYVTASWSELTSGHGAVGLIPKPIAQGAVEETLAYMSGQQAGLALSFPDCLMVLRKEEDGSQSN
ncbi:MAG: response regulator [Rhizobiaceae bacterium]